MQGGVWPWWQQGSSETYSVAPRDVGVAAGRQRLALGVRAAVDGVPALAERRAVAGDHRADQRVGARAPAALLGELDRAGEGGVVGLQQRGHVPQRIFHRPRQAPPVSR